MYASEVTARSVERASARLGFDLQYHSHAQIQEAVGLLNDLMDLERGGLKRNLAPDEQRFITNERTLCALDARYYLNSYASIVNWRKQHQLFTPNVAQSMMLDIWADFERAQRAIHIVQLKARRLGVSTLSELEVARRVQFQAYTNAVVASADPTKSVLMAEMIDYNWKKMPWWLMPKATRISNGMPIEFGEIFSGITIQAGNQFNGVARGATPNSYHVSEIAEWVDAEALIDGALLRAIIDTPDIFGMIEGTGEGRGNYLHKTWELIKQDWPLGRARQMPVFLPWYVGIDIYPSPAEKRARPMPTDWIPSDRTIRHAERARQYVTTNPLLLKYLAKGNKEWRMPREQMWFYEIEYDAAKKKKTLNIFLAEMCVAEGTRVSTNRGIKTIEACVRESAYQTETGRITGWHANGVKDVVAIATTAGRRLRVTSDHRIQLANGTWPRASALQRGDEVVLSPPKFADDDYLQLWSWSPVCQMSIRIDADWGRLLGFFIGDGCWRADGINVACFSEDTDTIQEVLRLCLKMTGHKARAVPRKGTRLINVESSSIRWWEMLWHLGVLNRRIHKKQERHSGYIKRLAVPEAIWRSPKPVVRAFLQGLFESDGHANRSAMQITLFSKSSELIRDVQLLLLGFGINASHRHAPKKSGDGHVYEGRCLRLNAENARRFYQEIGFISQRKQSAQERAPKKRGRNAQPITMTDVVSHVSEDGRANVYDLTIDQTHRYGANGIAVHNCSDDFEAFQSTNIAVVDQEIVMNYRERTRHPLAVYTIIGDTIAPNLTVPKREWLRGPDDPPPITIRVSSLLPRCPLVYQFVPVRFEGYPGYDPTLKLFIWEYPEEKETYGLGVDTSDGIGQDNSIVEVLRKANLNRWDGQVAEFGSAYIKAFQLWPMVLAIGCFYSVVGPNGTRTQTRVAIECKGNGEACQHELQKRGWRNFHPWKRYDNKTPTKDADVQKFGVYTNVWFRPQMMDMLLTCVDEEAIDLPSPYLVQELESLERDERLQKAKAAYGENDDRIMAIGFPLFSLHVGEPPSKQFARRRVDILPGGEPPDVVEYPIWTPGAQETGAFVPAQQILRGRMGRPDGLHRLVNNRMPRGFR